MTLNTNDPLGASPHAHFLQSEEDGQFALPADAPEVQKAQVALIDPSEAFTKQSIIELFEKAMEGTLPRSRELKAWEPARLRPQHLEIILLRAQGLKPGEIAILKDLDNSRVSVILNHPDSQFIISRLMSYRGESALGSVDDRLQSSVHELLDILFYHARNVKKPDTSLKATTRILDMAGHGVTKRVEVESTVTVDTAAADRLSAAIAESQRVRERGYKRAVFNETGPAGSGNASSQPSLHGTGRPPSQLPAGVSP